MDGVLSLRAAKLTMFTEMTSEVLEGVGRQRLLVATGSLSPGDELRRALKTTADTLVPVPALLQPTGECIKVGAGGSRIVRCLCRLAFEITREPTALLRFGVSRTAVICCVK